ncbi:hypothetical protein QUB60_27445, partial [Microcoleus sp. A2-C5]|uniref:hypothetical protein n=1 Tax=unclassified Microcoleus TaxID=2642155 RepID=UPI002FD588B0
MYIYFLLNYPIILLFLSLLAMMLPFFAQFSPNLIPHESFLGSDKYVVIRYSLAQNIVVMMDKIPN